MGEGNWYQSKPPQAVGSYRFDGASDRQSVSVQQDDGHAHEHKITGFVGQDVSLPRQWERSDNSLSSRSTKLKFSTPDGRADITLYDRGLALPEESSNYLNRLLSSNDSVKGARLLMPSEIKQLSKVMGTSTAGDNQFVNTVKPPDPRSPVFHLMSAQLVPINGRTVLEVQGHYVSASGGKGKEYRGVFVNSGDRGASVKEIFLQADSVADFAKHMKDYRQTLHSIRW